MKLENGGLMGKTRDREKKPLSTQHSARPTDGTKTLDEAFLRRLERLSLRSRRSFTHGIAGEHPSIRRGASPEFADYKPYSQGDDFRRVDWNIYARMGEMFVRLSEVNIDLAVHLLVDRSRSMDWGEPNKLAYAKRAAAALGYLALAGFDRVTI